jgi:hypothetical protein
MSHAERSLRESISAGEYYGAATSLTQYVRQLESTAASGNGSLENIHACAREVLEWARTSLLAARAHDLERLRSLRSLSGYRTGLPAPPAFQLRG